MSENEHNAKHDCCGGEKNKKNAPSCCKKEDSAPVSCCGKGKSKNAVSSCCSTQEEGGFISEGAKLVISAISIAAAFVAGFYHDKIPLFPLTDPSWIAVFLCAIPIYRAAFNALFKDGQITSSLLISIAMTGAFALQILSLMGDFNMPHEEQSYIFVVAEIAFLMALGEWLEERTVRKSRSGIASLTEMMPKTCLVKKDGVEVEIESDKIRPGDIICVRPNQRVPADGLVVLGQTSVDESNMTGESIPVDKTINDPVLGGTFNRSGYIEIKATKTAVNSAIAQLAKLVEEAEGKKAPISRIANRWASYVVPTAVATSIAVFFISNLLLGTGYMESAVRAVTVLVVFCPCAFVLATPTAISAGLGNAAKRGILIKSGAALEAMAKIDTVYFDKTGTLTKGQIRVDDATAVDGTRAEDLILKAASAEKFSEHPIARAIVERAEQFADIPNPISAHSKIGVGIEATVEGETVEVRKFSDADAVFAPEFAASALEAGRTLVSVLLGGKLAGMISLSDTMRTSSKEAVDMLSKNGVDCAMLSGDNYKAARNLAASVGINQVYAPLLPAQKKDLVESAQKSGKHVCMIGDGVNDAPALAAADSSIAIADLKSDLAVETAQVSLLGSDLTKIPKILKFSKTVMATIRTNITISMTISFLAVLMSLFGIITPVGGALLHNASSVAVVMNSARLLKRK